MKITLNKKIGLGLLILVLTGVTACGTGHQAIENNESRGAESSLEENNSPLAESASYESPFSFDSFEIEGSDILTGESLDNSLFAKTKLTLVNVWGTFCPPCIEEMPYIAKLHQEGEEDFQVLGVVIDTTDKSMNNHQGAIDILEESQADFKNLSPSMDFIDRYYRDFLAVPTSFIVDSQGKVIGKAQLGAGSYDSYKKLIEEALASLK